MKPEIKKYVLIGGTALGVWLLIHYWEGIVGLVGSVFGAAMPLVVGCVIAYLANIIMSSFEKHLFPNARAAAWQKVRRPVCMLLAFGCVVLILFLLFWMILPELGACIALLLEKLPPALEDAYVFLDGQLNLSELFPELTKKLESFEAEETIRSVITAALKGVGSVMDVVVSATASIMSGVVTLFLSLIFCIYLLAGKEKLAGQLNRLMNNYLKPSLCDKIRYVAATLNDSFHHYIVGQCTEAVILGSLCALGMLALRLPYAAMIGALVGVTALIPVAGAYIGAGVGAFMIFTVSVEKALIFLIFIVVLQQIEGNLIFPRVVGSSIGLPGLWVLAAVTVGGGLMGVMGMLVGVPLASTIYRLLQQDVNRRERAEAPLLVQEAPPAQEVQNLQQKPAPKPVPQPKKSKRKK